MIEFKRAGDAMVFECPAFKVEILASDAERIEVNPNRNITSSDEMMALLTDAFKILDMMIEHKARHTHVLSADINICEGINLDIEALKRRVENSNNLRCVVGD